MCSRPKGKDEIIIVIVRIIVRRAGWGVPEVKASPRDGNWWYLYSLGENIDGRYEEYCILLYGVTSQVRRGERIVKSKKEGKAVQFSSLIITLSFANESPSGHRV